MQKTQEGLMGEVPTSWANLAARVIRVALARADCSYGDLAVVLNSLGIEDTERALIARVARGSARFTLLLQILHATEAGAPRLWMAPLAMTGTWEARARAVMAVELSEQPWITVSELVRRLSSIGVTTTEKTLGSHLAAGTFSLTLFLQCMTVLRSSNLDRYIDFHVLAAAAESGVATDDA
ncbi:DUF6471 domain-containing protein [Paraburkholderia sp. CNPSo 3076]|uniref:DUF6471 domain-containing protein n=1 Tax=Paraburkholderia sp. CNPSo 3076 TaxID=2940936 RepID=UPI0022554707|nr:DUF6471 domain-containing protein [Paraburkholderia sp. CNPSo 3076]MCX5543870.1 DUF6471 domain-containing protein [Paraburkholderia sp. CNPSo 3076]